MSVIRFSDGYTLQIEDGASLGHIEYIAASDTEAALISEKIASEDLAHVEFLIGDDVAGDYRNLVLNGPVMRYNNEGGTVTVVISFREKTAVECRLDALEASQMTQDGAIEDIGQVLSDMVEG